LKTPTRITLIVNKLLKFILSIYKGVIRSSIDKFDIK